MRHYNTSCSPMYCNCVPTRKDGVPEFTIKALYVVQWYSDTISEITSVVISLMVYSYTTARQYRCLMKNSGMPSFLVGTQDMGPHEVS